MSRIKQIVDGLITSGDIEEYINAKDKCTIYGYGDELCRSINGVYAKYAKLTLEPLYEDQIMQSDDTQMIDKLIILLKDRKILSEDDASNLRHQNSILAEEYEDE